MLSTEIYPSLPRLVEGLLAELPGLLEPVARAAIWDSIEDFCRRSGYFRQITGWSLALTDTEVTVVSAVGRIHQIVEVYGLSVPYRVEQPDKLIPLKLVAATGTALVTMSPPDLESTPGELLGAWFRAFRNGALARLQSEPFKPYTNFEAAQQYLQLYEQELARAREQAPEVVGRDVVTNSTNVFDRLYANLSAVIPAASHTQHAAAVWNTIDDFCVRSHWFSRTSDWSVTPAAPSSVLISAAGHVRQVLEVYGLARYRVEQPDKIISTDLSVTASGVALVVLSPNELDNAEFAVPILQHWFQVILQGALGRLFIEPGRSYSSPELAQVFLPLYEQGVAQAFAQAPQAISGAISQVDALDRLYANITAVIPGVLETHVQAAAFNTIEDFCVRSKWFSGTSEWSVTPAAPDSVLISGAGHIREILEVYGLARYRVEQPNKIISIDLSVTASGVALVVLAPDSLSNPITISILQEWFQVILQGTLARLLIEPNRPYSNPELSGPFLQFYEAGIAQAMAQASQAISGAVSQIDDLDRLYANVTAAIPTALETHVQAAAFNAIEDFCVRSRWASRITDWTSLPSAFSTTVGSADGVVRQILEVYGLARYRVEQPDRLIAYGLATSGTALVAVSPISLSDPLSVEVIENWFTIVLQGTLARLYSEPGRAYSSPELAASYLQFYEAGIIQAAAQASQVASEAVSRVDALDRLYANVSAVAPAALETHVQAAAFSTIEDFCVRSRWLSRTSGWTVSPSAPVSILVSGEGHIRQIVEVYGLSRYRVEQPNKIISIDLSVTATGTALVVLAPDNLSNPITIDLLAEWFQVILQGTLARLLAEPGRPYSNPELSGSFLAFYEAGIVQAMAQAPQVISGATTEFDGRTDRIYANISAAIATVPATQAQAAVWNTIEDFLTKTGIYREEVTWSIVSNANWTRVSTALGRVQEVVEVYGVTRYQVTQPDVITSAVTGAASGKALVSVVPFSIGLMPNWIMEVWFDAILAGTLARLYLEPGRPWTNPELAQPHVALFDTGVVRAIGQARRAVSFAATETDTELDRMYANINGEIPTLVPSVMETAVWNAVESFCQRSSYYRKVVNWTASGAVPVKLISTGGVIQEVLEVYGAPRYRVEQPDTLIITDPAFTGSGTALVSLSPVNLANVPGAVLVTWFDAIRAGALAKLYADMGKMDLAQAHTALFADGIARAVSQQQEVVSGAVGEPDGLDRLYANVFAEVPLAPHTQVQMMAWNTIEDFCDRSGWYRKQVNWSLVDTDIQVRLTSTDGLINEVVEVYGLEQYRVEQPDVLIPLEPTEAEGTALVTLQPFDLGRVPEVILQTWMEPLRSGTLARLLAEPGRSWTDIERAKLFAAAYEAGVTQAGGQKPQIVSPQALKPDNFDRLYSNIYAELPEVPHTQVQMALWNTLEDFFIQSTARREHVYWQMAPGITSVDFSPYDGDWDVAWILTYSGLTRGKIEPPSILRDVTPSPASVQRDGQALLALKPLDFKSNVTSLAWSQWFEYIKSGTLYCLYARPNRDWSSPQLANFYGKRFRAGIGSARAFAIKSYTDGATWRFPYFARGRPGASSPWGGLVDSSSGGGVAVPPSTTPPDLPAPLLRVYQTTTLPAGTTGVVLVENTTNAPITISMPPGPKPGQELTIKDGLGNAGTYNITINGNGYSIDNMLIRVINSNLSFIGFVFTGGQWMQI